LAGELFRQYNKSHGVEMPDAVTAAIAIQNQAALWTLNRKHFPMAELTLY
jgi:predicted nucleic acid-binding protein